MRTLKPFKDATLKLSLAAACISRAIPTVTSLLHTLKPSANNSDMGVRDLKRRLMENLMNRCSYMEDSDIHTMATLLDPR